MWRGIRQSRVGHFSVAESWGFTFYWRWRTYMAQLVGEAALAEMRHVGWATAG